MRTSRTHISHDPAVPAIAARMAKTSRLAYLGLPDLTMYSWQAVFGPPEHNAMYISNKRVHFFPFAGTMSRQKYKIFCCWWRRWLMQRRINLHMCAVPAEWCVHFAARYRLQKNRKLNNKACNVNVALEVCCVFTDSLLHTTVVMYGYLIFCQLSLLTSITMHFCLQNSCSLDVFCFSHHCLQTVETVCK